MLLKAAAVVPVKSERVDRLLAVWPEAQPSSAALLKTELETTRATSLFKHGRLQWKTHKRLDGHSQLCEHRQRHSVIET